MCAFHSSERKNGSNSTKSNVPAGAAPRNGTPARTNGVKPLEPTPVAQERRVVKILQMIQSEPFPRIEDLAREFNLSHSHLEHLFKQQTGMALGQLLTEKKLSRAAYLLVHTNLRIKEIAYTVGYEHTSSFIRAFERHFTQAPHLYRQAPAPPRTKG